VVTVKWPSQNDFIVEYPFIYTEKAALGTKFKRKWLQKHVNLRFHVLAAASMIIPDGGSTHLWNVGRQLFYTAVYPRKQFWTCQLELSKGKHCRSVPCNCSWDHFCLSECKHDIVTAHKSKVKLCCYTMQAPRGRRVIAATHSSPWL
jgi:hypothetical protein